MKLTKAQKQAITYKGRNLQLIACAGSGKTEVVAQRVAHLLTTAGKKRLEPRNVVAFTFTNKAAAELKERIILRTREAAGGEVPGMADMYVGTIHGFCQELLQNEVPAYLKYEPLEEVRQRLYIDRKSVKTGLTTSSKLNGRSLRRWLDTNTYISALSTLREDNVIKRKLKGCSVTDGLEKYRAQLAEDSYFDFSSLLELAVEELSNNSNLIQRITNRVKYVVVDEYQDVNPIQERLIRLLHDLGAELCVVGDDDQTIYQWRGSSVENIIKFEKKYPHVRQINMEENFRSSKGVVETAREFVEQVDHRLTKEMKSAGAQDYKLGDVVALSFNSPEEEAQYIAETIKSLRGVVFDDGDGERGLSWSDMAILLRSVRANGPVITEALKAAEVPFIVTGLTNLFESDEAGAARDLFHYIADESITVQQKAVKTPTQRALRQSWENSRLGLTKRNLNRALRYAKRVRDDLHNADGKEASTLQHVFLKFLELAEIREESIPSKGRGQTVLFNLGRFSEVISDWESINFNSQPFQSFRGFARFLYYQADGAYGEGEADVDYITPDAVQVMTVH